MLIRKLFRTAWRYKAQFLSMIIMVAIGIGVFVGFNMEWYSLERNTSEFFANTNLYEYRLINTQGFSQSEFDSISKIATARRVLQVNVDVADGTSVSLWCEEGSESFYTVTGEAYDSEKNGFWLSEKFAVQNGYKVGETFSVTYRGIAISAPILGLGKSGEYMVCVADGQLMPDYTSFGFAFVSPKTIESAIGFVPYPMICLHSSLSKQELEEKVTSALGKTTLLLTLDEHTSYAAAQGEIEEGQTMVCVLPVLFLLIGVLTMITTMHRITANEKTQIGTLKALGFKNGKILRHYTSYGLFIGLVGAVLGSLLGIGICAIIVNPYGTMGTYFDMPTWKLYAPWWTWLILIGVVVFLTLISFCSARKMLKGTAADALRPYTPKKMKPLAIEKTRLWDRLHFTTRWNLRDVFRHKTRSLMSLVGVIGCMLLLVCGLGMHDTVTDMLSTLDAQILNYQTRVNFTESVSNEEALSYVQTYGGDYLSSQSVQVNGDPIAFEIYGISHDSVRFFNQSNQAISLSDDGVYICMRLAEKGIRVGDEITVSPYGTEQSYRVRVAGIVRSFLGENIALTTEYAQSVGISYTVTSAFFNLSPNELDRTEFIAGTQEKAAVMDSFRDFMAVMNIMVLVLVLAAVVLGVVVLYNLGVMSYVERYRELATLKVVGFKNKQIGRILIGQNLWLTVLGILVGLPAGVGVLQLLLTLLGSEYELKMVLGALTYCVSILLTFGVSLAVGLIIARKNKKVNMVEALKGAE